MGQCPMCGATTSPEHAFCLACGEELDSGPKKTSGADEIVPPSSSVVAAATQGTDPTSEETDLDRAAPSDDDRSGASGPDGGAPEPAPRARRPQDGSRQAARARDAGRASTPRPSGSAAIIPGIAALLLSVALQQAVTSLVPPGSYLHRLFRPQGGWVMGVVPGLIAFALVWTLVDLLLKYRVARANERDLARNDVNQMPALVAQESPGITFQRLRGWDAGLLSRPVGRRVHWLLQHLETTEPQRAHELVRHQSDLEADAAASGYRTVKLFIWAMPILGFIGTVLGISLSVGGFSDFLTTNVSIDEIDRVTEELGNVASGLSFAFDTTLLGLLGGLVASVVSSGVQAREERFLTRLEELGLRILESAASHAPSRAIGVAAPMAAGDEFDGMMRSRLKELSAQMEHFTKSVRSGLDGFLSEWGELPPEVERVAGDLNGLREHLAAASKGADQLLLETRLLLEGLNETSSTLGNRLNTSIGSITQTVEGLGGNLEGVSETLTRSMSGLSERLTATDGQMRTAISGLQEAVDRNHRDGSAAVEAQVATERTLQRLAESISELSERLGEVKDAQAALTPVLSQLSGPLELRLMPSIPTRSE